MAPSHGLRLMHSSLAMPAKASRFRFNNSHGSPPETEGTSFTFLGFCHVWGKTGMAKRCGK